MRGRGFDFFTLTDQHTIEGCLRLEGLPGVFNSEQVTALFPEDRVPVEILVWGLSEAQHRDILALRSNVYDLQGYLTREELAHAVAHPFVSRDNRLQAAHVERLILLFKHFESLHGIRAGLVNDFTHQFLSALCAGHIEAMVDRHGIAPTHPRAWEKVFVGGSGDEVGMFAGRAWTQMPAVGCVDGVLSSIKGGLCEPNGRGGGPLVAAHSIGKKVGLAFFGGEGTAGGEPQLPRMGSFVLEGRLPSDLSWGDRLRLISEALSSGAAASLLNPSNYLIWKILFAGDGKADFWAELTARLEGVQGCEERAFIIVNQCFARCLLGCAGELLRSASAGNYLKAFRDAAALIPAIAPLVPYFFELRREAPRLEWMRDLSRAVHGRDLHSVKGRRVAWFTDTLEDMNGVSMTIRKLAAGGRGAGVDVQVVCCRRGSTLTGVPIVNFEPVAEFELPEYERQKLALPPVLEMVEYIQRERFTEVVISTPGPVGLVGLLSARLLGLATKGIYHTDFPRYVGVLTEDGGMESLAWGYMHWFFAGLDSLYVNSTPYLEEWVGRGVDPVKLRLLPRGIDSRLFSPAKRSKDFWTLRGADPDSLVLLYVGRVSKEKDLDMMPDLMNAIRGRKVVLAVVGDGPYSRELKGMLPDAIFTGALHGEELAAAYASADVFVFPSTTDTYGNVVVEALASGLPCVVSNAGGPAGLIKDGVTGLVAKARDKKDFTRRVLSILESPAKLGEMRQNVLDQSFPRSWEDAAVHFFG